VLGQDDRSQQAPDQEDHDARQRPQLSIDRGLDLVAEIDEAHRHGTRTAC
jgi:hypothetical protein